MIAIGGAIGVGLFLGSAQAIQLAGPALLLAYAIGGMIMFFLMRALGELALYQPVAGSFSTYASEFIAPWVGFVTGWNYWIVWVVTGMEEITAVGVYFRYWFPEVPQWIPALLALLGVYIINLIAVRLFGEFEFWFAMIKVVTIVALIVIGLVILFTGWGNGGKIVGFSNLWVNGGLMPNGILGILLSLQMVMFSFLGMELIGVTAGEAKDPAITLPKAINATIWRILIFYIGALAVILSLYPWNTMDGNTSPFVLTFAKVGIPAAAGIINFVVLTAALSSCNSGVFSTGRMLYTLAGKGHAPSPLPLKFPQSARPGDHLIRPGDADRSVAQLRDSRKSVYLHYKRGHFWRFVDLEHHRLCPLEISAKNGCPGRIQDARISLYELGYPPFSGDGCRSLGLQQ